MAETEGWHVSSKKKKKTNSPYRKCLQNHVAVRLNDHIVVMCLKLFSEHYVRTANKYIQVIWMYNLWTEQWKKYSIPTEEEPPPSECCAVALASDIYIFGGVERSRRQGYMTTLWKLTDTELCTIQVQSGTKTPSPRAGHCGWEHGGKMWIFGGHGLSPVGDVFLNDYGDFEPWNSNVDAGGYSNQFFSYDPSMNIWENVKPSGKIPLPRKKRVRLYTTLNVHTEIRCHYTINTMTQIHSKIILVTEGLFIES